MAILNSTDRSPGRRPLGVGIVALWLALSGSVCGDLEAPARDDPTATLATRARHEYELASAKLASTRDDELAEWQFARACFDLAEFATNSAQRATLAKNGIAVSRRLLARKPDSVGGHYYLAMNLGQLARTKLLGALKLVAEMESLFLRTVELDAAFDHAGAHRCLGLLYRDAPGWPASVGSRKKSRLHLDRAAAMEPDHPENRLVLLESQLKWGLEQEARESLQAVGEVLRRARDRLKGERWQADWANWDHRWQTVLASLNAVPLPISSKARK